MGASFLSHEFMAEALLPMAICKKKKACMHTTEMVHQICQDRVNVESQQDCSVLMLEERTPFTPFAVPPHQLPRNPKTICVPSPKHS
jgi:hypothetical protein